MRSTIVAATSAILLTTSAGIVPAEAGTIIGRVMYSGSTPQPRRIHMTADPECDRMNPDGVASQTLLVAPDGAVAGAVVSVKQGLRKGETYAVPATPAMLDEKGCMFVPHVLAVQAGQILEITNKDPTMHSVHAAPAFGSEFNIAMPALHQVVRKRFDAREVVRIKCDVHPWMSAYVAVFEHPFFAISLDDGRYAIGNVPNGTYTVEAWHETLGVLTTASVKVGGDPPATADFTFAGN